MLPFLVAGMGTHPVKNPLGDCRIQQRLAARHRLQVNQIARPQETRPAPPAELTGAPFANGGATLAHTRINAPLA
ncbi:MAG: hypothetical protein WDZ49_00705 [Litorilinea sp.]